MSLCSFGQCILDLRFSALDEPVAKYEAPVQEHCTSQLKDKEEVWLMEEG